MNPGNMPGKQRILQGPAQNMAFMFQRFRAVCHQRRHPTHHSAGIQTGIKGMQRLRRKRLGLHIQAPGAIHLDIKQTGYQQGGRTPQVRRPVTRAQDGMQAAVTNIQVHRFRSARKTTTY
ncbi:MAG: hypothetical protein BWY09_02689 [Candidatus Hydrogenedentes bacterium ADurb.Bin179]|nr:MAG: hypothetical protein BWY09_02689 [Candidatus Hydrogenedentes bacterium ADurb.Bin179]